VTGDESWFDYEYVRKRIWTGMDDNAPEVANRTIASQKTMLTVLWNPDGFHVAMILPARHSFTAPWFIDQNLQPMIDKFFQNGRRPGQRKLGVHVDNAAPHNARMTRNFFEHTPLNRSPDPPYSPEISPSDFYVFGKIKPQLIGHEIPDEINLCEAVSEILNAIFPAELQRVFHNWSERLEAVIAAEVDYITQ
jgi:hypothetical protein